MSTAYENNIDEMNADGIKDSYRVSIESMLFLVSN